MADTSTGVPSAAALLTFSDALASMFKGQYANLGIGASTETTTLAAYAKSARAKILGDGTTSNPGLGNAPLQAILKDPLATLAGNSRYDSLFATYCRSIITAVNSSIATNLPKDSATGISWAFTNNTNLSALNSYLLYLNALNATCPTTPAAAGTLTGATVAGGGLQTVAAGSAYYVVHCLVSATGDWYVSLPSAEATRVALTGSQNAYTYQIAGTVPSGIAYVAVFRGLVGGASGTEYLDTRTAVAAGSAYPAITISNPDSSLRMDWTPPSWAQCLWVPESAAIFALANATAISGSGASQNPLPFTSGLQLSPNNVVLTPTSGFLGIGNPPSTGIFGIRIVGTGYTAGSIATANNNLTDTTGFLGAGGAANILQARATATLNAASTCTPTYNYYDAAHGYGSVQSATASAATFGGTAVGSLAPVTIANGRIVIAVTSDTTGLASGTYQYEGTAPRSY